MSLLRINNLSVQVGNLPDGQMIVQHVSLTIEAQMIMALVGGSGSGKSTTGLTIMRLLAPGLKIVKGEILFEGRDLLKIPLHELRQIRGQDIAMVFQEPLYAFNPVLTIGEQIAEVFMAHSHLQKDKRHQKVMSLLDIVGIKDPHRVFKSYPHQLSGGMRQRAMIAQAIALNPKLIIADEPTSSLDVTLQARIMELLLKLRKELHVSVLLITHDLGVVEHMADQVAVMNRGMIIEKGSAVDIFKNPQQQYTRELLAYVS